MQLLDEAAMEASELQVIITGTNKIRLQLLDEAEMGGIDGRRMSCR